jgi:uncharacterized protein (TIGR00290 family)
MAGLLFWSGGKDSWWALRQCGGAVRVLLATYDEATGRVPLHEVDAGLLEAQAAALGLPLMLVGLPAPCPNEDYAVRVRTALAAAVDEYRIDSVVFGDLHLADIRQWREELLAGSGLAPRFPLWGLDTAQLAAELVASGTRAVVTCVDTAVLDPALLGREYDAALLAELPEGADPCGENGEFHTFVYGGPGFAADILYTAGAPLLDGRYARIALHV